jgi:hypothetical protein
MLCKFFLLWGPELSSESETVDDSQSQPVDLFGQHVK